MRKLDRFCRVRFHNMYRFHLMFAHSQHHMKNIDLRLNKRNRNMYTLEIKKIILGGFYFDKKLYHQNIVLNHKMNKIPHLNRTLNYNLYM